MFNIYKQLKYVILISLVGFLWEGCNVINPPESVPTYIHIDSFQFKETAGFPILTHQITNVWVYYNNNPVGSFDLPATIPVIAAGNGNLSIFPGIAVDGLNSLNGIYPFYQSDTFSFTAQPGKTIIHEPHTQFYTDAIDTPISDFTFVGHPLFGKWSQGGNIGMTVVTADSLTLGGTYGGAGSILLTNPGDSSVDSSFVAFSIPAGAAFIEFDYKNDVPFAVGLQANLSGVSSTPYYLGGAYASSTWQKFYLSVADFNAEYKGDSYNFYIKAVLPPGQSRGRVLIDNIQFVHF